MPSRGVTSTFVRLVGSAIVGLIAGVLFSVLPFGVVLILPALVVPIAIAHTFSVMWRAPERAGQRLASGLAPYAPAPISAFIVVLVAVNAPLKFLDTKLGPLERNCVTVREIGPLLHLSSDARAMGVDSETLDRTVCLTSTHPTLRQVHDALESQLGLNLEFRWCVDYYTVLWGPGPIGGPQLRSARR
jgi:hypothetical protein